MEIKKLLVADEIEKCSEVIFELRPHLRGQDLTPLFEIMRTEGFHLIYIEEAGRAIAFAGYRYLNMFYSGKTLYIDDLATLPAYRSKGCASALLDFLIEEARLKNCDTISLDSGHQRFSAHRLYLNKDFEIKAHHFERNPSK